MVNDLEEIKQRVKIIDICAKQGINLIKRGKNHTGLCPFHNEKTPSFHIDDAKNFYKCFGCGAGGDVISFYKDFFKIDYATAIKELKEMAGLNGAVIPATPGIRLRADSRQAGMTHGIDINKIKECMSGEELYIYDERLGIELEFEDGNQQVFNKAAILAVQQFRLEKNKTIFFELWTYCLKNFNRADSFRKYLIDNRRLSGRIIEKSDLFFIGDYYRVNNHLKKLFSIGDLQRCGLYNENGNLIFFSHKIIIPYKWKNEIVYLRGRLLPGEDTKFSKYLGLKNDALNLNTPKRFYNVDIIERLLPGEHIYITEGELDALMMEDLGFNSVAIPGVGNIPNDSWLKRLFPFKVFLTVDNDEPGKQLEDRLRNFYNDHYKTIYSKQLGAKDVTELVQSMNN